MNKFFSLIYIIAHSSLAFAQEGKSSSGPSFMEQALLFGGMFLIFFFFVLRPQAKKQKTHEEFMKSLKKGDRVLTSSGILGTIEGLTEKYVKLEIADDVSIRVLRSHVSQTVKEG